MSKRVLILLPEVSTLKKAMTQKLKYYFHEYAQQTENLRNHEESLLTAKYKGDFRRRRDLCSSAP